MFDRRSVIAAAAAALVLAGVPAARADAAHATYTQAAFDEAVNAGKPVLVHIATSWCPICKAQKPILEKLRAEQRFKDLVELDVDFDADKASARALGAQHQSTLIVYRDGKEVGRSVGEAQAEWIEDLLEKALPQKAT